MPPLPRAVSRASFSIASILLFEIFVDMVYLFHNSKRKLGGICETTAKHLFYRDTACVAMQVRHEEHKRNPKRFSSFLNFFLKSFVDFASHLHCAQAQVSR